MHAVDLLKIQTNERRLKKKSITARCPQTR